MLRPYQVEAREAVLEAWKSHRSVLLVMSTGTGKTFTGSRIVAERADEGRILWLAHRGELLDQAAETLHQRVGLHCNLEKAELRAPREMDLYGARPVVVASVPTMRGRRLKEWDPTAFATIVVDEAHHAPAKTYRDILGHFEGAKVLGLTATPDRGDGTGMHTVFDHCAYEYDIRRGIREGYLCSIRQQAVFCADLDLSDVKTVAGDLSQGQLEQALIDGGVLHQTAAPLVELAGRRQTLVFTAGVAQAHALADVIAGYLGNPDLVKALDGNTPKDLRRKYIGDFRTGRIQYLLNCAVLTEGFDAPETACVAVARPTKSRALYCFDEKTELLTRHGWRQGHEVAEGEEVMAFDPATGSTQWEPVMATVHRELFDHEHMVAMSSPTTDVRVTNTHRMVYRLRETREKTPSEWRIAPAGELERRGDSWQMPMAGTERNASGVPLTDAELAFIGWVQTDGTVNRANGAIVITQQRPEQFEHIEETLTACGFKWRFDESTGATNYGARRHPLRRYRVSQGKPRGEDKHLRGWGALAPWLPKADPDAWARLEEMSAEQWAVLLDAWHRGDGSKQDGQSWTRRSYHLAIADKAVADWVQGMCMRRGWRANVAKQADLWMVHCRETDHRTIPGQTSGRRGRLSRVPHEVGERVWCVSVPSGAVLTRRNGKGSIMGQTQMIGRGTRIADGKEDCLILDFTGNSGRHRLVTPLDVLAGKALDPDMLSDALGACAEGKPSEEALLAAEQRQREREEAAAEARRRAKQIRAQVAYQTRNVDPFDFLGVKRDGRGGQATDKQLRFLRNMGVELEASTGRFEASKMIDKLQRRRSKNLCSYKQARLLARHGLPDDLTFSEAREAIDAIAGNNWKAPKWVYERFVKPGETDA